MAPKNKIPIFPASFGFLILNGAKKETAMIISSIVPIRAEDQPNFSHISIIMGKIKAAVVTGNP